MLVKKSPIIFRKPKSGRFKVEECTEDQRNFDNPTTPEIPIEIVPVLLPDIRKTPKTQMI